MLNFKKKSYVRFVNLLPGVELVEPVIPAAEYKPAWMANYNASWKAQNQENPTTRPRTNTSRCPGIHDLMHRGFIITAPIDFTVITNGDGIDFKCDMSTNPAHLKSEFSGNYISGFMPENLAKFSPMRSDTIDSIIKVDTFWRVTASDDLVLLQIPIAYPDHSMFTAVHGICDPANYYQVIIQLQWHKREGEFLVEAGTPLCQMIPVPRDFAVDLYVDRMNDDDKYTERAFRFNQSHKFRRDIPKWRKNLSMILNLSKR